MSAPISALTAARRMCERSGWTLTNLKLQKILYLVQMVYMGQSGGERLFNGGFEAWDFGPVAPSVYHQVKPFGAGAIGNIFPFTPEIKDDGRVKMLDEAYDQLSEMTPGQLVNITHWSQGAWAKNYVPNVKGISIPDEDILEEYRKRTGASNAA